MSMVIRVVSVGGCSRQYESCLQHKCHLVLGVSPITMMKCCRPGGYPGAGRRGGRKLGEGGRAAILQVPD